MAKAAAKAKTKKTAKGKGGIGKSLFVVMMCLTAIWPTACIIIPGMLPTLVALITDRDREKSLALTMGATNLAGCLPFVMELWRMGQNVDNAMKLLRDPMTMFIMLAAAGVGYAIYAVVPTVVANIIAGNAVGKIARLQKNLVELQRLWGTDVVNNKPPKEFGDVEQN